MMKYLKKMPQEETGGVMVLALLMLTIGSLLIIPMMALSDSTLDASQMYQRKTAEIYAAHGGLEEALWHVKYGDFEGVIEDPAYDKYDFDTSWGYTLSDQLNNMDVDISLRNVWIPKDITPPDSDEARGIIEDHKLVVTGGIRDTSTYEIKIAYYPEAGDSDLIMETIGIWLPHGFTYVTGSSNLDELVAPLPAYYTVPVIESYCGGEAIVWSFDSTPVEITDLPGADPADTPIEARITFEFTSLQEGASLDAVSWVTTSGVGGIEMAWDANTRIYHIISSTDSASIESYLAKSELRDLGSAIDGDYRAIGNSLMLDLVPDAGGPERDTLLEKSEAAVDDIPSNAQVEAAYLYWTGWLENPITLDDIFNDNCSNFIQDQIPPHSPIDAAWSAGSYWTLNDLFTGHATGSSEDDRKLTMSSTVDLSSYSPGEITVSWDQDEDGYLESSDCMRYYFYDDAGNWDDQGTAFCDDNPSSSYSVTINDDEYLHQNFKIRFYLGDFSGSGEYCYIDNIKIAESIWADTSVIFEIDGTQVYWDDGEPSEGVEEITADEYQVMQNVMSGNPHGYSYSCFTDVTGLVHEFAEDEAGGNVTGNGTYTLGSVSADLEDQWAYAGWSLLIIYTSAETAGHQIYLYDDLMYCDENTNLDFDQDGEPGGIVTGFMVPEQIEEETDAARLTCFIAEGDNCYDGDYIAFNDTKLWDGTNTKMESLENVWNGQSAGMSWDGIDIDTFDITWDSGLLEPGDTSAQIDMVTDIDSWNMIYIILSFRSNVETGGYMSYLLDF
ncbi:MAG: hypothetical protein HQ553_13500 [Chloroflexi bacterium]|nr:hypothetical protein [Chloroflexota bacterium]